MMCAFLGLAFLLLLPSAQAYPPAPDHTFYGTVRNEWGDPINVSAARVFILSTNGAGAAAPVAASTQPGINYRLIVPMDSARSLKADLTSGGSLRQTSRKPTVNPRSRTKPARSTNTVCAPSSTASPSVRTACH
jgi:hypothetical protein